MFLPASTSVFAAAAALSNWSLLTASVPSVPSATLVILLPPASMPSLVTLGPPAMVIPSVFITVSPAVTLSTFRSRFRLYLMSLPSFTTCKFSSPSAVPISTVSPALTAAAFSPLVCRVQPLSNSAIASPTLFTSVPFTL
ncbi:hypothetical protein Acal02_03441 [Acinetobacter calcoaceticus]